MLKFLLMMLISTLAFSASPIDLKNEAMKNLQQFSPGRAIPHYNPNPLEANIHPENQGDTSDLKSLGHERLSQDRDARFIYENENQRIKIAANEKDKLLQEAELIIEHAEENIYQQCHDEKVPCDEQKTEHVCHETAVYENFSCHKILNIKRPHHDFLISKRLIGQNIEYDLTKCGAKDASCQSRFLISLHPHCENLKIELRYNGRLAILSQSPTCQSPRFIVAKDKKLPFYDAPEIKVQEYWTEESWENESGCDFKDQYFCVNRSMDTCIEKEYSRNFDGVPIYRSCWEKIDEFDCAVGSESNCGTLEEKGCANLSAICLNPRAEGRCDEIERTYQCIEKICYPDKRVCTETLACVDGRCDLSKNEESDDIQEGISRLGAVAGSAEEVASKQSTTSAVEIFKGERKACSEMPLNLRDCCVGEGFLEGVFRCPADLRELQKAKLENRATLVGTYNEDLGLKKIYVYCVFPTKLAGILQIQGRLGQLGIGFGEPKNPKCDSGFKASLLEKIDFKRLDLTGIVDDFRNKAKFKTLEEIESDTKNHAHDLHDKGQAHD